jgi:hypothetical protein
MAALSHHLAKCGEEMRVIAAAADPMDARRDEAEDAETRLLEAMRKEQDELLMPSRRRKRAD